MASWHITRPAKLDPNVTLYYHGGSRWSDESVGRINYSTKSEAQAVMENTDGKNGGFANATLVEVS